MTSRNDSVHWRALALWVAFVIVAAGVAGAQEIPRGRIVPDVKCAEDPTQSYALYVPSAYTAGRQWPVLFAFHPAARGIAMVEKYAAAAEQYGYIVAGSNNSRNGDGAASAGAVRTMPVDVGRRFSIDPKRVYLAGFSGGARVAMDVALTAGTDIAGVIASSAGFPYAKPRAKVPFAVFGTAGTEDFNYLEMRTLDRKLTTPHAVVVFDGGHALPPDAVALEAIEWIEIQAMTSGRRPRDEALIDRLLATRRARIDSSASPAATVHLLDGLVADFDGLRDVSGEAARAKNERKRPDVKKALDRERSDEVAEERTLNDIFATEASLSNEDERAATMLHLRDALTRLNTAATAAQDTPERARARRVLRVLLAGAAERVHDDEYRRLLQQFAPQPPRGRI